LRDCGLHRNTAVACELANCGTDGAPPEGYCDMLKLIKAADMAAVESLMRAHYQAHEALLGCHSEADDQLT
jgi:hypothetical protein